MSRHFHECKNCGEEFECDNDLSSQDYCEDWNVCPDCELETPG